MEDGTEQQSEEWQAHDLGSGVAQVYQDAKRRSLIAIQVAVGWAVFLFVTGSLGLVEASRASPPLWDFGSGLVMVLCAAGAVSRTPTPLLIASLLVLADLAVLAFKLPLIFRYGDPGDYAVVLPRIAAAPVVLGFLVSGYIGCLSIEAFKRGFSPGEDWRTRFSPLMLRLTIIGACVGAMVIGFSIWMGAIRSGFAESDYVWGTEEMISDTLEAVTGKPANEAKQAARDFVGDRRHPDDEDGEGGVEPEIELPPKNFLYPEDAIPVDDAEGMDIYAEKILEDALWFAEEADRDECLMEALGKQDRCRDERCRIWARFFARACFPKAHDTKGTQKDDKFCEEVPDIRLERAGESWAQNRCAGREYESCRLMLYTVQGHCHPPTEEELARLVNAEDVPE